MDTARITLAATLPAALSGAALMHGAVHLIVSTLEGARVEVRHADPGWMLDMDLAGAAALGVGALAAGGVVSLVGRLGSGTPERRSLGLALGSATVGMAAGLCGAAFHTARTAVPAAMGADVAVVTPVVDATSLILPGWAAGGVSAGLIVYAAVSALAALLLAEPPTPHAPES